MRNMGLPNLTNGPINWTDSARMAALWFTETLRAATFWTLSTDFS